MFAIPALIGYTVCSSLYKTRKIYIFSIIPHAADQKGQQKKEGEQG
jgi:hypothetical protein